MVLDACALIAFFNDEPGAEIVASALRDVPSVELAAINLLEIAYDAIRRTGETTAAREILEAVRHLPIRIRWDLGEAVLESAAQYKATSRISLADAIALAFAGVLNAPLVTSDHHEFDDIEAAGRCRFIWIR